MQLIRMWVIEWFFQSKKRRQQVFKSRCFGHAGKWASSSVPSLFFENQMNNQSKLCWWGVTHSHCLNFCKLNHLTAECDNVLDVNSVNLWQSMTVFCKILSVQQIFPIGCHFLFFMEIEKKEFVFVGTQNQFLCSACLSSWSRNCPTTRVCMMKWRQNSDAVVPVQSS